MAAGVLATMPLPEWQDTLEQEFPVAVKLLPLPAASVLRPSMWAEPARIDTPSTVVALWQFWQLAAPLTWFSWPLARSWSGPALL